MYCLRYIIKNVFVRENKKKIPEHMKNWFQIEYGKNWESAYENYLETGSIHHENKHNTAA